MISYIIRRSLYSVPILIGVSLITFFLFFFVNPPDNAARKALGGKLVTPEAIEQWKKARGYDLPRLINKEERGLPMVTRTVFWQKSMRLFLFDFGKSDVEQRNIGNDIYERMWASLSFTVPTFIFGLFVTVSVSLMQALVRGSRLDIGITVLCVLGMSVSMLFYIIGGQWLFAKLLRIWPVSGYEPGLAAASFVAMPVLIGIIAGIGGGARFYRTVFLEEMGRDYVRTARAKGVGEIRLMFGHVLKNAMIPILTQAVAAIPFLFTGSLLVEAFFAIPGLGDYTLSAIQAPDFAIVRAMVFLGSLLYIVALMLTDISYTLVDPRVTLESRGSSSVWIPLLIAAVPLIAITFIFFYIQVPLKPVTLIADLAVNLWELMCGALSTAVGFLSNAIRFIGQPLKRVGLVFMWTDLLIWAVTALVLGLVLWGRTQERWRAGWRQIRATKINFVWLSIILAYAVVALADSIHWRYDNEVISPLDLALSPLNKPEETYSAPLASHQLTKVTVLDKNGNPQRIQPALKHPHSHLLGTDKVGRDVFIRVIKSIRTGFIIGGTSVLIALPFAIAFGVIAGYFGRSVDDIIVYFYTTLGSIPSILLIASIMQIIGAWEATWQATGEPLEPIVSANLRLLFLVVALGLLGWVGLCRLLRGETFKLASMDYVRAAKTLGVRTPTILLRHVVPNLTHIVLITLILGFSRGVLAEAVLSYVGIGVDPSMASWGNMINLARNELSRDPIVWWNLVASFIFMLGLVLPVNLFGDALRDAMDPRLQLK